MAGHAVLKVLALVAGMIAGADFLVTVSVKLCVADELAPLVAVMVNGQLPAVPTAGVPARVAPRLPFGVNVTPEESAPVLLTVVATGKPAGVVTVKLPAVPAWQVAWSGLVMLGDSFTVRVNAWLSDGAMPLSALMLSP